MQIPRMSFQFTTQNHHSKLQVLIDKTQTNLLLKWQLDTPSEKPQIIATVITTQTDIELTVFFWDMTSCTVT